MTQMFLTNLEQVPEGFDTFTGSNHQVRTYRAPSYCTGDCTADRYERPTCQKNQDGITVLEHPSGCPGVAKAEEGCCIPRLNGYVSSPHDCKAYCDEDPECKGFSWKYGICNLVNFPESALNDDKTQPYTVEKVKTLEKMDVVYWKNFDICAGAANAQIPCSASTTYQHTLVINEEFTDNSKPGWSTEYEVSPGNYWSGTPPAIFKPANVFFSGTRLRIRAKDDQDFAFPEASSDCSCAYDNSTGGVLVSDDTVSYGWFESRIQSVAQDFQNAFWMQSDNAEVNLFKYRDGTVTVSAYCFDEESTTYSYEEEIEVSLPVTIGLIYASGKLEWLANGERVANLIITSGNGNTCLRKQNFQVLFSVDGGQNADPSDANNKVYGQMFVDHFRAWDITKVNDAVIADDADGTLGVVCDYDLDLQYSGMSNTALGFANNEERAIYEANMGVYQGPSAGSAYHKGVCGSQVARNGAKVMTPDGKRTLVTTNLQDCGDTCTSISGCNIFYAKLVRTKNKRWKCFFYAFDGGSKRAVGVNWLSFERKVKVARTCDTVSGYSTECDQKVEKPWFTKSACTLDTFTIDGEEYNDLGRTLDLDTDVLTLSNGEVTHTGKSAVFTGRTRFKTVPSPSLEDCKAMTDAADTFMRNAIAQKVASGSLAGNPLADSVGCNSFQYDARKKICEPYNQFASSGPARKFPDVHYYQKIRNQQS